MLSLSQGYCGSGHLSGLKQDIILFRLRHIILSNRSYLLADKRMLDTLNSPPFGDTRPAHESLSPFLLFKHIRVNSRTLVSFLLHVELGEKLLTSGRSQPVGSHFGSSLL